MTLNDAQVKAEKPGTNRRRVSDGGGLLLEIDPSGGKYWLWRHRYPPTKGRVPLRGVNPETRMP